MCMGLLRKSNKSNAEAFSITTKMAASVESTIETVRNKLDCIISVEEEQTVVPFSLYTYSVTLLSNRLF